MSSGTRVPSRLRWGVNPIIPIGDGAVFLVFTVVGLLSHNDTFTPYHFLRNFIPLTLSWFLVAIVLDTYGIDAFSKGGAMRLAVNWLVGVSAGVAIRVWWVGGPNGRKLWVFLAVALLTNGAFLVIWRLIAARLLAHPRAT